jgi:glycosyltransferase involved in cell wall biosynthesis
MPTVPQVSVVVAAVGSCADIERSVRSALTSDLQEVEVILVDAGPQPAAVALAEKLADPRIIAISVRSGGSLSRLRNIGIARARATYLALLVAGDQLEPSALSGMLHRLQKSPQAGFAFGEAGDAEAWGRSLPLSADAEDWSVIGRPNFAHTLLRREPPSLSAVTMRRELINEIGPFDESTAYFGETDLWFRLAHACDAGYWRHVTHRIATRQNASADGLRVQTDDHVTVLRRDRGRGAERTAQRQIDRLIAQDMLALATDAARRGDRLRALALSAQAFVLSPGTRAPRRG